MVMVEAVTLMRKLAYLQAAVLDAVACDRSGDMRDAVNALCDLDLDIFVEIPESIINGALSYLLGAHSAAVACAPDRRNTDASTCAIRADAMTYASRIITHYRAYAPFAG